MSNESTKSTHPAYGLLSVHRVSGGNPVLFGSGIKHHHKVRLVISRGSIRRNLNSDWYSSEGDLIEIEMSPVQWAEAIATMNVAPGTPCTLLYVGGEQMPEPPQISERATIQEEFKKTMQDLAAQFEQDRHVIAEILAKKSITMADRKQIGAVIDRVMATLTSTVPFVHSQFDEAMEDVVAEAKGEIETFLHTALIRAGQQAIAEKTEAPKMLEDWTGEYGAACDPKRFGE